MTLEGEVGTRPKLTMKARQGGRGTPFLSLKVGWNWFHLTRQWHFIEQLVDRRNNRYKKNIRTEDGTVIRDDDGLLTDHQGYGDAKKGIEGHRDAPTD